MTNFDAFLRSVVGGVVIVWALSLLEVTPWSYDWWSWLIIASYAWAFGPGTRRKGCEDA